MGGQACILYGAAEFSRDTDFAVLSHATNLKRLRAALNELRAEPVFVPTLEERYLLEGHACHFRCQAKGVEGLRVDVMSVMRGCDNFHTLWRRRKAIHLSGLGVVHALSLPDLVRAKKTQRDKDWPMIRRLVEADYSRRSHNPKAADVQFWLCEMRSPELLVEVAQRFSRSAAKLQKERPLLRHALRRDLKKLRTELAREEERERTKDREYWTPLRKQLAELRMRIRKTT